MTTLDKKENAALLDKGAKRRSFWQRFKIPIVVCTVILLVIAVVVLVAVLKKHSSSNNSSSSNTSSSSSTSSSPSTSQSSSSSQPATSSSNPIPSCPGDWQSALQFYSWKVFARNGGDGNVTNIMYNGTGFQYFAGTTLLYTDVFT